MTCTVLPLLRQAAACLDGAPGLRSNHIAIAVALLAAFFATH